MAILPRRPVPLPDESPASLLFRAAIANGWRPHLLLKQYLNSRDASVQYVIARATIFKAILEGMGLDEGYSLAYRAVRPTEQSPLIWNGVAVPRHWLRLGDCALCPACISTDSEPYGRSLWDHRLVRGCADHSILLVSQCESCLKPIEWDRPQFCFCECGFDFRNARRTPASAEELSVITLATTTRDRSLLDTASAIDLILTRLIAAGVFTDTPPSSRSSLLVQAIRSPGAFVARLAFAATRGPHLASSRIVFRELLELQQSCYAKSIFEALDSTMLFSIQGLWKADLSNRVNFEQSARILGSKRITSRLIEDGHILHPQSSALSEPNIALGQLNSIMLAVLPKDDLSTPSTAKFRPIQGVHSAQAIGDIIRGGLRSGGYTLQGGLSTLRVEIKAIEPEKDVCTLKELASRASVHPEYVRFLFRCNFLQGTRGAHNSISISLAAAESFLSTFSFVGPLARKLGLNPTNLAEKLQACGINPVSGPSIDGGLCYLFRHADLVGVSSDVLAATESYPTRTGRKKVGQSRTNNRDITYARVARELGTTVGEVVRLVNSKLLISSVTLERNGAVEPESLAAFKRMLRLLCSRLR